MIDRIERRTLISAVVALPPVKAGDNTSERSAGGPDRRRVPLNPDREFRGPLEQLGRVAGTSYSFFFATSRRPLVGRRSSYCPSCRTRICFRLFLDRSVLIGQGAVGKRIVAVHSFEFFVGRAWISGSMTGTGTAAGSATALVDWPIGSLRCGTGWDFFISGIGGSDDALLFLRHDDSPSLQEHGRRTPSGICG